MKKLLLLLVIVPMCAWGQVIITIAGNTPVGSGNGNSLGDIGAVIGGGNTNKVTADNWSGIFNGNLNLIESCYGVIAGGAYNCLSTASSCYGTMGGGKCNTISACYSSIISGYKNIISSSHSVVVGGDCNCITDITGHYSCYSFIGGGKCNFISRDSCYSFIGGGGGPIGGVAGPNCICVAAYSGIASGSGNCIAGTNTVSNCYANFSFIGGGASNHIGSSSAQTHGSMIGGGFSNTISGYASSIVGGKANIVCNTAKWSSVVGGQINKVAGFNSNVLSGCNNKSTGNCSVVLGGQSSCDNGFNYAGVFGCNVIAAAANTFHVECLNAVNTPFAPGGAGIATGGIYWDVVGSAGKALYIK